MSELVSHMDGMVFLCVMLVSVIPLCESKIALPLGMSTAVWGERALSAEMSFLACFIGSTIAGILVYFLLKPIIRLLRRLKRLDRLVAKIEDKFKGDLSGFINIAFFIMLPLPMTGVWAGAGMASLSGCKAAPAISAIAVGNFVAVGLIYLLCNVFKNNITLLIVATIVLTILYACIQLIIKKKKRAN